ncbi:MAG: hypothetical protein P8O69_03015 [Amylibacter sp.]|nr:hypothetical protein [Amylibacter sp.]
MMLRGKAFMFLLAFAIILLGLLRRVNVQIFMSWWMFVMAFSVIEGKFMIRTLQGLFVFEELFRTGGVGKQRVVFWFGCCAWSYFGSAADTGLVRR